ncbi:hypothetical protein [Azospirillum sp. TSO22-1]|uniref:hypothetical protein n=1 Tax=Azospirillum sp. TSO22-1 TaxID=716789 RepID=UPI000D6125CD|nr:hypothetical protein [Azospirillum sp. TSO22-1]PWC52970.1 hypothetical protein TSO221_12060 [Azospirillum sp. TSO22-1]
MSRRLVLAAMLSLPLCGCYGLWDTNQTLIQFVTGAKLEVAKKPTYAEERDGARRRKVIVKTKAEAEAEKGKKGGDGKPGEDSDVAILKKAQERVDNKDKAPTEPKPVESKPAESKPTPPADAKPEDTQVVAKPQYPEQKAPPAVPRPAVKVDASADAAGTKPMMPLPSPAKSIPQNATPAEKSWQAKTAKRDKKAPQQQERKADAPAEGKPAEPAQAGDAPKPS